MKDIELLWEYQQLDIEVDKLENELKSSEERKKALYYKNVFYKAQEEMQAIESNTDALLEEITKVEKEIDDLTGEFTFEIENDEDLELARKCAAEISNKIAKLDRVLKELAQKADNMEKKMAELSKKATSAKKEYGEYKALFDNKNAEMAPLIKTAKDSRDSFAKKINKELMDRYIAVKTHKGMPISLLEDSKCTGCNMSLPSAICSKVKEGIKLIECETCGKILYAR